MKIQVMGSAKKGAIVIVIILGIIVFGYTQYTSVSQIKTDIVESQLFNEDENGLDYNIELRFENPTLLLLTAGETQFLIISDDEIIGTGQLEPFLLNPLDSTNVKGTFHKDYETRDNTGKIKITGETRYDMFVASIDIPFVFYPTDEQTSKFIHQN